MRLSEAQGTILTESFPREFSFSNYLTDINCEGNCRDDEDTRTVRKRVKLGVVDFFSCNRMNK